MRTVGLPDSLAEMTCVMTLTTDQTNPAGLHPQTDGRCPDRPPRTSPRRGEMFLKRLKSRADLDRPEAVARCMPAKSSMLAETAPLRGRDAAKLAECLTFVLTVAMAVAATGLAAWVLFSVMAELSSELKSLAPSEFLSAIAGN